jgi:hypothetical protein
LWEVVERLEAVFRKAGRDLTRLLFFLGRTISSRATETVRLF